MTDLWRWLENARADRADQGLVRTLVPRQPGPEALVDLASNDYLGLARHPAVVAGAISALHAYGAGSTGSRLVTGTTQLHEDFEDALAARTGAETALVFSSGYLANLGAVLALVQPGTLVVSDADNHASLVDACRLANAPVMVVPHASPSAVDAALAGHHGPALVVTDAVFSVTGDLAPLTALHDVVRRHQGLLLVDEAHALGVVGPRGAGACAAAGLGDAPDVIRTVTLSKALGSQGGAVLGPAILRDHLIDTARSFVFDTGLAPSCVGAALVALSLIDDALVASLRTAAATLATAVGADLTPGAVVRVPTGDPYAAVAAQRACLAAGVRVGCFRPPSVPRDGSCLRLAARADLTSAELALAAEVVNAAVRSR